MDILLVYEGKVLIYILSFDLDFYFSIYISYILYLFYILYFILFY